MVPSERTVALPSLGASATVNVVRSNVEPPALSLRRTGITMSRSSLVTLSSSTESLLADSVRDLVAGAEVVGVVVVVDGLDELDGLEGPDGPDGLVVVVVLDGLVVLVVLVVEEVGGVVVEDGATREAAIAAKSGAGGESAGNVADGSPTGSTTGGGATGTVVGTMSVWRRGGSDRWVG